MFDLTEVRPHWSSPDMVRPDWSMFEPLQPIPPDIAPTYIGRPQTEKKFYTMTHFVSGHIKCDFSHTYTSSNAFKVSQKQVHITIHILSNFDENPFFVAFTIRPQVAGLSRRWTKQNCHNRRWHKRHYFFKTVHFTVLSTWGSVANIVEHLV